MKHHSIHKTLHYSLILLSLLTLFHSHAQQQGLENIIVEKYYVSGAQDTAGSIYYGELPEGSVSYRIYVDLLPGYTFQAAYGMPAHPLSITTSTSFFNHTSHGNSFPNIIPRRSLKNNTVLLDSWLTAGAAGEGYYGLPKSDDDTLETVQHQLPYLQAIDELAGRPVSKYDGMRDAESVPRPTFFGIDSAVTIFKDERGNRFYTTNGAWACLGKGANGVDSLGANKVLIAQLTTDGQLNFEINIQIGTPDGKSQNYVAVNPQGNEILLPALRYEGPAAAKRKRKTGKNKGPKTT